MQTLKLTKKYETYPEYKDSGVEWLGMIPREWNIVSSRQLFLTTKERVGSNSADHKILSLTLKGVVPKLLDGSGKNPTEYDTYQEFKKDDLVFCLFDYDVTPRTIGYVEEDGMMTGAYTRLIPQKGVHSKYFYYYFLVLDFNKELLHLCTGLRNSLSKPIFWSMKSSLPDFHEQEKIAKYLDNKLTLLDKVIERKEKLIILLKEKRLANIDNAVTKGLNRNATLIESGIPWIGKIPETWQIKKLKYLTNVIPSNIDKLTVEDEEIVRLCNYVDVYKNEEITTEVTENFMVASATKKQIEKFTLLKNDVIITKDSETPDDIGVPAFVPETLEGIVCGYHLAILRSYGINGEYLFRCLQSNSTKVQFFMSANGLTRYAIGIGDIGNLAVVVPPKIEQNEIQKELERQININDLTVKHVTLSIEKLKEFKISLISNVVTGKIKV